MKRFLTGALALAAVASAFGQGTFTIRRPVDGSKVREVIKVRIPKNSIPEGGYIGVFVNGKFLEARMPDVEGQDYVYNLDSQKRGLADGENTIEVVLYMDFQERARIVSRSSVKVIVENKASIKIPEDGLRLRYRFTPGSEHRYQVTQRRSISVMSQAMAAVGGRATERSLEAETFRFLYAVDNAYNAKGGREGLVRMQGLPMKGKDYVTLTLGDDTEPRRYYSHEMFPIFTRMSDTGREVFSSAHPYFPMEGTSGESSRLDLYGHFPLPILPTKAVKPGESWAAAQPISEFAYDEYLNKDKFVLYQPGRGTFEGVEWRNGVPCARIRAVLSLDIKQLLGIRNINQIEGIPNKVEYEQLTWFALDRGVVVRTERNITQESLVEVGSAAGGTGGVTGPGRGGDGDGGGAAAPEIGLNNDPLDGMVAVWDPKVHANGMVQFFRFQRGGPAGIPGGPGGGQGEAGARGGRGGQGGVGVPGRGGPAGFGGGAGGGTSGAKQVLRVQESLIFDLER